jgi:hypothetical protein
LCHQKKPLRVEGPPRGVGQEAVPVDGRGGSIRGNRIAEHHFVAVHGPLPPGFNQVQLADGAVANQFFCLLINDGAHTLTAHLDNPTGAALGRDYRMALLNGMHHGFLAIHVLPGVHGVDGSLRVPVVRCGHYDGVDVLARQQFPIIRRHEEVFSKHLPRARTPARVKIGNRHQRGSSHLVERHVHIRRAAPAQTDRAELDAVVGGNRASGRRAGRRRGAVQKCGRAEKLASGSGHPKLPPRVYL